MNLSKVDDIIRLFDLLNCKFAKKRKIIRITIDKQNKMVYNRKCGGNRYEKCNS